MTPDDVQASCLEMINRLLVEGFERPIYFSAIAIDGLTTVGSSESVTGSVPVRVATSSAINLYLPPIHFLFVDPKGRVAHGVIEASGTLQYRILEG
jgi:hypothetical protein